MIWLLMPGSSSATGNMTYAYGPTPEIPLEFDGVDSDNEEDVNDDEGTSKEDNMMENLRRQTLHGVTGPSHGITK